MSAVNFDLLSAKETLGMLHAQGLLLSEQFELFDYLSVAKRVLPEWCCRKCTKLDRHNGAAILAASWARLTILAASLVNIYQTCSKYGNISHTWRISGSARQYDHARKVFRVVLIGGGVYLRRRGLRE